MTFEDFIFKLNNSSVLHFESILEIVNDSNIKITNACLSDDIVGLTTLDCIYIDIYDILSRLSVGEINLHKVFFILLHEIAHKKRIDKFGVDYHLNMLTTSDFKSFYEFIIFEELFADRWAALIFYFINQKKFHKSQTQELYITSNKELYITNLNTTHKLFKSVNFNYDEMIKHFLIYIR
tara:strand:- start:379 stop:918 length:540 start_codon:yes stop_codon:yes gene_type:complete